MNFLMKVIMKLGKKKRKMKMELRKKRRKKLLKMRHNHPMVVLFYFFFLQIVFIDFFTVSRGKKRKLEDGEGN